MIPTRNGRVHLGELLVRQGHLTPAELARALDEKKRSGRKLGQVLVGMGLVGEAELAGALRQQGKVHCLTLTPRMVDQEVAESLGEERSRRLSAIAVNKIAGVTTVAMEDPADIYAVDDIGMALKSPVLAVYAEPSRISAAIAEVFGRENTSDSQLERILETADEFDVRFGSDASSEETETGEDLDQPVIKMIRRILQEAVESKASDIHFESRHDRVVVRFRVDGTLYDRATLPKTWARPCLARLKVLANLDIAQRRLPQDGRFQADVEGRKVQLRLATTPSLTGEGAVIRILASALEVPELSRMGLAPSQLAMLERLIESRDGCILTTGPTGSGKTTTLYSILGRLNSPDRKIITLEDPVEIQQDGLTQIHTNAKAGLTFATGLRSILRQDPDVVLVGEMRDQETAMIGVQAALTGHLVLSTLHTVGTAETISRLVDMGVEPYLLSDTLRGIIAQRLVRRVCDHCKRPARPTQEQVDALRVEPEQVAGLMEGAGCERCHGTGFKGRLGLYELLAISSRFAEIIGRGATTDELRSASLEEGLWTLRQDGLTKAGQGLTTLQEILAVTARDALG